MYLYVYLYVQNFKTPLNIVYLVYIIPCARVSNVCPLCLIYLAALHLQNGIVDQYNFQLSHV